MLDPVLRGGSFQILSGILEDSKIFSRVIDRWFIPGTDYFFSPSWDGEIISCYIIYRYKGGYSVRKISISDMLDNIDIPDRYKEWMIYNLNMLR